MKARYMLDTDTCIYLKNHRPTSVVERFHTLRWGEVIMSLITYGELYSGAQKARESGAALANLRLLGKRVPVQPLLFEVAENYGHIRSQLEQKGTPIGNNDLWIAAHALALDVTLVSNNTREFQRIPELKLENWV